MDDIDLGAVGQHRDADRAFARTDRLGHGQFFDINHRDGVSSFIAHIGGFSVRHKGHAARILAHLDRTEDFIGPGINDRYVVRSFVRHKGQGAIGRDYDGLRLDTGLNRGNDLLAGQIDDAHHAFVLIHDKQQFFVVAEINALGINADRKGLYDRIGCRINDRNIIRVAVGGIYPRAVRRDQHSARAVTDRDFGHDLVRLGVNHPHIVRFLMRDIGKRLGKGRHGKGHKANDQIHAGNNKTVTRLHNDSPY